MRRSYVFRLRPTRGQQIRMAALLEDHRLLYNAAVQERRDAYRHPSHTSIRFKDQSAQLKEIRADDPDGQGRWSATGQQQTLRRVDKAFAAFFRRVREGQTPGYPRFKGRGWFDTVDHVNGDGAKWNPTPNETPRVYFLGVGHVKVNQHRAIPDGVKVKQVSLTREGSGPRTKWFVVVSCDYVPATPLEPTGAVTGIDAGVAHYVTTSEGEHVENPKWLRQSEAELADAQRVLSRTKRGSSNRKRARRKVAAVHARVKRRRTDFLHKTALHLVRDYDVIVHEDLAITNMTGRAKPVPSETPGEWLPNGAAAKSGLNKSILDASWGAFYAVLAAKAESAGRTIIAVDAQNTSRTCPTCGHGAEQNRPTQENFTCVECGFSGNADHVGATNVLRRGLASQQEQPAHAD